MKPTTPRATPLADQMDDKDLQLYAIALEYVFQVPFDDLVMEAARTGVCDKLDLLEMGQRLYRDIVRVARGELSEITLPARLPNRGEFHLSQEPRKGGNPK